MMLQVQLNFVFCKKCSFNGVLDYVQIEIKSLFVSICECLVMLFLIKSFRTKTDLITVIELFSSFLAPSWSRFPPF